MSDQEQTSIAETQSAAEMLRSLDRFVVDNDELLELEEAIGRFNIFDALGISRVEIRHSNFLAWLLDPGESHGQGALFLKAILMDLLRSASTDRRPLSPVELDGLELRGVEIRREWHNIDLLVLCQEPKFLIAIENKIDSGEHSGQLQKYENTIAEHFPDTKALFVFLTTDGADASDEDWLPYSYRDIHRVFTRTQKTSASAIGDDVLTVLDHYLRLIGSRFMDDPLIDDLCRRIYRNHRQALELIYERIAPGSGMVANIEEHLSQQAGQWQIVNRTSKRIDFFPTSWESWLPPLCGLPKANPKSWFVWTVAVNDGRCNLRLLVRPCTDVELRRAIVKRLLADVKEFGFSITGKATDKWTTVFSTIVSKWNEDDDPDPKTVLTALEKKINELEPRLRTIESALYPLFVANIK